MSGQGTRNGTKRATALLIVCAAFLALPPTADAQEPPGEQSLFKMPFGELMDLEVAIGNLIGMTWSTNPVAMTIITRDDIEKTPARNILDLMEVYVPGLLLFNDSNAGPAIKIRGLGIRNFKTLLLVNGRPVNQKAYFGSVIELRNWDLNDIERIEVIRGPGSVTYGPGAISGVINVVTRQAGALEGFNAGVEYNGAYDSTGGSLQYGWSGQKFELYAYLSIRGTGGYEDNKVYQTLANGQLGYKGTSAFTGRDGNPVMSYYRDYQGEPQLKAHLDLVYGDDWRLWARYTSNGQIRPNSTKMQYEGGDEWEDNWGFQDKSLIAALENTHTISDSVSLRSIVSFDSEDYFLASNRKSSYASTDVRQRSYSFAENELFVRSVLNYEPSEELRAAVGFEYSHDSLGDNWGESDTFHARAGKLNFFSETSPYKDEYSPNLVKEFNSGWSADTYSLMGEIGYEVVPRLEALASARVDKNTYTDTMFSSRVAAIYSIDERNTLRVSWQRSLRMNTMMELYFMQLEGQEARPEKLNSFQLIFDRLQNESLALRASAYYNQTEVMSWTGTNSDVLGEHDSYGVELEAKYNAGDWVLGANHSYFHLVDWDFYLKEPDGSSRQDVSLSDYFYIRKYLTFESTGSSINYWADNITKLYARVELLDDWTIHVDSRIVWDFEYGDDLMQMYRNAYDGVDVGSLSPKDREDYDEKLALLGTYEKVLNDKGAFGVDWRLNASLTWDLPYFAGHPTTLTLFCRNLLGSGDNKRYSHGVYVNALPVFNWVEEPRAFGLRFSVGL